MTMSSLSRATTHTASMLLLPIVVFCALVAMGEPPARFLNCLCLGVRPFPLPPGGGLLAALLPPAEVPELARVPVIVGRGVASDFCCCCGRESDASQIVDVGTD